MRTDLDYMDEDTVLQYGKGTNSLFGMQEPDTVDGADMRALYEDEQMIREMVRNIGNPSKNGSTAPASEQQMYSHAEYQPFMNRSVSPDNILIRDGFLLAAKHNLSNIGGQLRYAYLTDEDARQRHIDSGVLINLRKIKDKAEQIYQKIGGDKSSLKQAILTGNGNKDDHQVPFYEADQPAYSHWNTISNPDKAVAHPVVLDFVTAVSNTLKQFDGLFILDKLTEAGFRREPDPAISISRKKIADIFRTAAKLFYPEAKEDKASIQSDSGASKAATEQSLGETTTEPKSILNAPRSFMEKAIEWIGSSYMKATLVIGSFVGGCILLTRFLQGKLALKRSRNL